MVCRFYIPLILFCVPLSAALSEREFNTMIKFMRTISLETASPEQHNRFMGYAKRISTEGSLEQQTLLEGILESEEEDSPTSRPLDTTLSHIEEILKSDIITPEVWQNSVMKPLIAIDSHGSPDEKQQMGAFLATHMKSCARHIHTLIQSMYHNPETLECLKYIVMGTLIGVIPSVGLKGLSILSGNMAITTATQQLSDLAILSALDSIVQYTIHNRAGTLTGPIAAALSSAVQDFTGYIGPRPANLSMLGLTFTTPELAMLQASALVLAKKTFVESGGAAKVTADISWQDVVIGNTKAITPSSEEGSLIQYLSTALSTIVENKTVRAVCATTVSYALEGALTAAALNAVGIGFYGESTTQALFTGMTRGALEGLYLHMINKTNASGIIQRVQGGFAVATIQKYLSSSALEPSVQSMVPLVTQQVLLGTVNAVVQKNNGWKGLLKNIFG